jgi:hypothetical protein
MVGLVLLFQNSSRIADDGCVGGDILGYDRSGAYCGIFSHRNSTEQSRSGADGRSAFDQGAIAIPVRARFEPPGSGRRARVSIINKINAVPDEYFRFEGYALADECVTGNFATRADRRPFLNLYERSDPGFVADLAPVKVNESVDTDITPQLYVRGNELLKR